MLQVGDVLGCDELTAERWLECMRAPLRRCARSAAAAGVSLTALIPITGCGGTVELPGAGADHAVVEWATYGRSQLRTFFSARETRITRDTVASMRPKWQYLAGAIVTAAPTVAHVEVPGEGRIKVVFISSWDGNLSALRASNGSQLWHFTMKPHPGNSYPQAASAEVTTVAGAQRVYVAGGRSAMTTRPCRTWWHAGAAALLGAFCLLHVHDALAMPMGSTCADCHDGGVAPLVQVEGPREVMAGALATFTFVVHSQSPIQLFAGFNVAATDGVLDTLPGQGAHIDGDEITHDEPKESVAAVASWEFTWQAPIQVGTETLFSAGLSANGNGTKEGDNVATTTLDVTVSPNTRRGDANYDTRLSASDLTAAIQVASPGGSATCGLADADCNHVMDTRDTVVIVALLFEPAAPAACSAWSNAMVERHEGWRGDAYVRY